MSKKKSAFDTISPNISLYTSYLLDLLSAENVY